MSWISDLGKVGKAAKNTGLTYKGGSSKFSASTSDLMKTKYTPHPSEGLPSTGRTVDNMPKKKATYKAVARDLAKKQAEKKKPVPGKFYASPPKQRVMGPDTQMQSKVDDLFGVNW
jgi:hypothetical protein